LIGPIFRQPIGQAARDRPGQFLHLAIEQSLLVIEAMKLQSELAAPVAGKIANLAVKPGETVEGDQMLLEIRA
jgi:acetyl/propionyl-CoA carboxylase alpha subunit